MVFFGTHIRSFWEYLLNQCWNGSNSCIYHLSCSCVQISGQADTFLKSKLLDSVQLFATDQIGFVCRDITKLCIMAAVVAALVTWCFFCKDTFSENTSREFLSPFVLHVVLRDSRVAFIDTDEFRYIICNQIISSQIWYVHEAHLKHPLQSCTKHKTDKTRKLKLKTEIH